MRIIDNICLCFCSVCLLDVLSVFYFQLFLSIRRDYWLPNAKSIMSSKYYISIWSREVRVKTEENRENKTVPNKYSVSHQQIEVSVNKYA